MRERVLLILILVITGLTLAIMVILYQRSQPIIEQAQAAANNPIGTLLNALRGR